jgi:hypothetical protein
LATSVAPGAAPLAGASSRRPREHDTIEGDRAVVVITAVVDEATAVAVIAAHL